MAMENISNRKGNADVISSQSIPELLIKVCLQLRFIGVTGVPDSDFIGNSKITILHQTNVYPGLLEHSGVLVCNLSDDTFNFIVWNAIFKTDKYTGNFFSGRA